MTTPGSSVSQLGATAFWTAAVRAMENTRADRLFADPWAEVLAGEVGAAWMAGRTPESVIPIVLRTRYFDDFLLRVAGETSVRQFVLPAAGLDTRAFRLDWPAGTRLFELDQPPVLAYKQAVLDQAGAQPNCARITIPADLTHPWQAALETAGYRADLPACWLLEGFLFYLESEVALGVLEKALGLCAAGSWLGLDVVNSQTYTSPLTSAWLEMQAAAGAPWRGAMDDPVGWLAARNWRASLTQAGAEDAHHARWPYPVFPVNLPNIPHNWFVTARKREN